MNAKRTITFALILLAFFVQAQESWHPAALTLPTRWSKEVGPANALPEYPRPQLVRPEWVNLNGLWDYAITDSGKSAVGMKYDGKILVPYPLESALSGVKKALQPTQELWYHRHLSLNKIEHNRRYLLHFGAVDFQARVLVNGKPAGEHTGGYQEFTCDITGLVKKGANEISVAIWDPTDDGINPHGKQSLHPAGIMYTAASGVWQTVWMEIVPEQYIHSLTMTPDVDGQCLNLTVNCAAGKELEVEAMASDGSVIKGPANQRLQLKLADLRLWSPDSPFLYDLSVRLLNKGKVVDEVKSYFGMRKIEIRKDAEGQERIFLNNRYTFNLGVLDQGYWPDGLYTAPTDAALKWDIEAIKSMGFNTIRKHIKIEPARWYYHCDRIGMLVWQDMPYPGNLSPEGRKEFERENAENIEQLHNSPSIVCWVLFNEGWNRYDQERLTKWVKKTDPSRLVDGHTGENYDQTAPADPAYKWFDSDLTDVHEYPGPGIAPYLPGKARALGEWGGVRVPTPGHQWNATQGWGYIQTSKAEIARKYDFLLRHLQIFEQEGLSASIYTQPFDVEIEENGLITYDREVFKIPVDSLRAANRLLVPSTITSNPHVADAAGGTRRE
ncbi:MAG TPA: glycoside hydrolase family 2 TIM barrel-domain containing protein [Puia sp.]|uniref:glycoside hydrolase family 2 protein n=1 Tax=Puia sp. TaxID=2045100 RepID=UPI002C2072CA|nr:sugar-binding domain-containing protein [Puia sp.]HVU95512.1 glycoside hydrolase family 2 TIM barrel-domain containing protein [Puia sp.]